MKVRAVHQGDGDTTIPRGDPLAPVQVWVETRNWLVLQLLERPGGHVVLIDAGWRCERCVPQLHRVGIEEVHIVEADREKRDRGCLRPRCEQHAIVDLGLREFHGLNSNSAVAWSACFGIPLVAGVPIQQEDASHTVLAALHREEALEAPERVDRHMRPRHPQVLPTVTRPAGNRLQRRPAKFRIFAPVLVREQNERAEAMVDIIAVRKLPGANALQP
mmetsp:Transcript_56859/g.158357  ORF Transcript_56859/g.158357 Transcript_56859/m.158357 type:complete len:218 (+) Transcript_56859:402-1055(+)